jgi:outer membrane biosynthesis protein TonB
MEELIRQAFLHVDVIGPHVAEGHYDLVGPNGEIILPQVWETMIEPDWVITMHMWPIPEPPPPPPAPPAKAEEPTPEPVVEVPPPPPPAPPPPTPPVEPDVIVVAPEGNTTP